jgi:hypothetical protein
MLASMGEMSKKTLVVMATVAAAVGVIIGVVWFIHGVVTAQDPGQQWVNCMASYDMQSNPGSICGSSPP